MSGNIKQKISRVLDTYSNTDYKYHVHLTHDGFDRDCYPKSYIYDLFVLMNGQVYCYHYENWFHPGDDQEEFEMYQRKQEKDFFENNAYSICVEDFMSPDI
jgi:hypothetical protein